MLVMKRIEQPVRAFVEAKTLTIELDDHLDVVKFEQGVRGFGLDIQRTRELHAALGEMLARVDEEREAAAEHDAAITGR